VKSKGLRGESREEEWAEHQQGHGVVGSGIFHDPDLHDPSGKVNQQLKKNCNS